MFNNNLLLDENSEIKIKQNHESDYIIKESFLKHSIEVTINPHKEIDFLNLYIILKSYSCNIQYMPYCFFVCIQERESMILHNISIDVLKKMTYIGFNNWIIKYLNEDWKYIKENSFYSFVFLYPVELFDRNLLKILKPKYPWSLEILNKISVSVDEDRNYKKVLDEYKKKIEELEKVILEKSGNKKT